MSLVKQNDNGPPENWELFDADQEPLLKSMNWGNLLEYAAKSKKQLTGNEQEVPCQLSPMCSKGGQNIVRRLEFQDGSIWIARLQIRKTLTESPHRLITEVHTIQAIRERSKVPVPEVFAYELDHKNTVGAPFMIQQYIPGKIAMDCFGGYRVHRGSTPRNFNDQYYKEMATIQAELASIRFPKIGSITRNANGELCVGPMPKFGGPFDCAADFFQAWAANIEFPRKESMIRERTPTKHVDDVLESIRTFPSKLASFAQRYSFQEGPFPLIHVDLYKSNVIVDEDHHVLAVIDWEDAIVAPWELVEFIKDLTDIPPVMDGPLYQETERSREIMTDRETYIQYVRGAEIERGFDHELSSTLGDARVQNLAQGCWLYQVDGRIGFYTDILKMFE